MGDYNILKLNGNLKNITEGNVLEFEINEERIFPETIVFLQDDKGIVGLVKIEDYVTLNDKTSGSYRVVVTADKILKRFMNRSEYFENFEKAGY